MYKHKSVVRKFSFVIIGTCLQMYKTVIIVRNNNTVF